MPRGLTPDDEKRAEKYADLRVNGVPARQAARQVGYAESTDISQIERPGGPVDNAMSKALKEKGIDEGFLAGEYAKGLQAALTPGAADSVDAQAHAKYLLQLGYLLGYGRNNTPQVAVQINNSNPAGDKGALDTGAAETLSEVRSLLEVVRAELSKRDVDGVHVDGDSVAGRDQLHADSPAHPGVVPPGGAPRQAPGGSQP